MSTIKRYDAGYFEDIGGEYSTNFVFREKNSNVNEAEIGRYVLFSDHEAEVERLRIELELYREKARMYDQLSK